MKRFGLSRMLLKDKTESRRNGFTVENEFLIPSKWNKLLLIYAVRILLTFMDLVNPRRNQVKREDCHCWIFLLFSYFCLCDYKRLIAEGDVSAGATYDSWGLQWAGQDLSGFTKLKFFHYRRRKELEDIPDQSTTPPFPCLKNHRRQTQEKEKSWASLGRRHSLGLFIVRDGVFLRTTWIASSVKGLSWVLGRQWCSRNHTKCSKSLRSSSHAHLVVSSYPTKIAGG